MDKIDALKDLARSSFLANSYKDSYKYSASLIDIDPSCADAWLIKGLSSAALMASDDNITIEEVMFSLDRGTSGSIDKGQLLEASNLIAKCYLNLIKSLEKTHQEQIVDHHKVPMPAGGSALLHRVAQKGYARLSAKNLSPKRLAAIKLIEKSYNLNKNEVNLRFLISGIDSFLAHSIEYGDYLSDEKEINSYLVNLRSGLVAKSSELGFSVASAPPAKSGCFIATAATGSYDHPKVVLLRLFRDDILKKHFAGRLFIRMYYRISPPLAQYIENSERRKYIVLKLIINPLSTIVDSLLKK